MRDLRPAGRLSVMAWFRRVKSDSPGVDIPDTAAEPLMTAEGQPDSVLDFWSWWQRAGATEIAQALDEHDALRVVSLLSGELRRVHPGLRWELASGVAGSARALVVTPNGDPRLRPVARRWRRAAPPADELWCFSDTHLPAADLTERRVELAGESFDVSQARVAASIDGDQVDVQIYHPGLDGLDRRSRRELCALVIDSVIGEAAVDTWIRYIDASSHVDGTMDLPAFRGLMDRLARNYPLTGSRRVWWVRRGIDLDGEFFVRRQQPMRSGARPDFDTHVRLVVPYPSDPDRFGFHDLDTSRRLTAFEQRLEEALGADGQLVATETRPGRRVMHCYADSGTDASRRVCPVAWAWPDGSVTCDETFDPAWEAVSHLG